MSLCGDEQKIIYTVTHYGFASSNLIFSSSIILSIPTCFLYCCQYSFQNKTCPSTSLPPSSDECQLLNITHKCLCHPVPTLSVSLLLFLTWNILHQQHSTICIYWGMSYCLGFLALAATWGILILTSIQAGKHQYLMVYSIALFAALYCRFLWTVSSW